MKKILIAVVALFTFLIFSGLGLVVLFSNSFGINIDNSSLFPQVEVTTLDEETADKLNSLTDYYSISNDLSTNLEPVTLVNQSGRDITVDYTTTTYPTIEGTSFYMIDGYGIYLITEDNNVILKAVPDTYEHYLTNGNGFASYDDPQVYASAEELIDIDSPSEIYDSQQVTEDTIILKDGESYEIKLPE